MGGFLATVLVATLVVAIGPVSAPATAQTTLCSGVSNSDVKKCDAGWAANMHLMHWRMYRGHNCTNFVAYALKRDGVAEPSYLLGNANTWASRAKAHGVLVDNTPRVGAVGAWPGRNHVVYVEEVGPGYLITSEDNYPGYYPKGMYRRIKVYAGESAYPKQFIHFKRSGASTGTINGPAPTVSGTPVVGSTLTAKSGTWTPSGVTLAYRWLRDGLVIGSATGTSYTLTPADAGRAISVSVTGTKSGLASRTVTSAPTAKVAGGDMSPGEPTVSGSPQVGATLTADPGTWEPGDARLGYQWLADGSTLKGATNRTFVPATAQLGKRISVRVTGEAPGFETATVESARTDAVTPKALVPATPTIVGAERMRVGDWVSVDPGEWRPSGVALSYQWYRGTRAVTSGTGTRYKVTTADLGQPLVVKVTGSKSGYPSLTTASDPTAAATSTPVINASVKPGKGKAVVTVIVSAPGVPVPAGRAGVYEGSRRLKELDLAVGRPGRATLRVLLGKGIHTLTVRYGGSSTVAPGSVTLKTKVS